MGTSKSAVKVREGRGRNVKLNVPFMVARRSEHRDPDRRVYRFYFQIPARYLSQGCDVPSSALGDDIDQANATAALLYAGFVRWKQNRDRVFVEKKVAFGTFDWLAGEYLKTEHYRSKPDTTRHCYRSDLRTFSEAVFKHGKLAGMRLGGVKLGDLTRKRISSLIDDLHVLKNIDVSGTPSVVRCGARVRTLVATACTVWNHMSCKIELRELESNPFEKHRIKRHVGTYAAASYEELLSVVAAADDLKLPVVGTIAACCFDFRWRPKHVVDCLRVEHYRPPEHPGEILITDTKNEVSVWRPLFDADGRSLYPLVCERLDALKGGRVDGLMFNQAQVRAGAGQSSDKKLSMDWLRTHIRKVCLHAGTRKLTLTTYRRGGITEMAEAKLTPHQIMSHTLHKHPGTLTLYIERTTAMQRDTQVQVLEHRENRQKAETRRAGRPSKQVEREPAHAAEAAEPAKVEVGRMWGYGMSWNVKVA